MSSPISCSKCGAPLPGHRCDACNVEHLVIEPHPGPQSAFLASPATIRIYGGAAGGGKTWALLIDALGRALSTPGWSGLVCRSLLARMTDGGGAIWAEAHRVFEHTGAEPNEGSHIFKWPNGSTLTFRQIINNRSMWNGASFDWIGIEELQEVEISDLVLALTRLRSTKGISPTLAATCNPKRGHGLVEWISWYLLPNGEPDPARSGVVRWFARSKSTDAMVFAGTAAEAELLAGQPAGVAKSYTYVRALLEDNPSLCATPDYLANILVQGRTVTAQLHRGNWLVGGEDLGPLRRERWEFTAAPLAPIARWCRAWDTAATRPSPGSEPDYTMGPLVAVDVAGRIYFAGLEACREDTPLRDRLIARTAELDGSGVTQLHKQSPGDAGKSDVHHTRALLQVGGGETRAVREAKNKNTRIQPTALALELGMLDGKPVDAKHLPRDGEQTEPRFFVLDGPPQEGWPASYRQGWLAEPYRDAGSHPKTVGELAWSHFDPWPRGDFDDLPDAFADAFDFLSKPASSRGDARKRAKVYT